MSPQPPPDSANRGEITPVDDGPSEADIKVDAALGDVSNTDPLDDSAGHVQYSPGRNG